MFLAKHAPTLMSSAFGGGTDGRERFIAIAGRDGLRWIIPTDLGRASRVLANWQPLRPSHRLGWFAVQALARSGALALTPGMFSFSVDFSNVRWADFGWTGSSPPRVIAYVGTPGPHQKLVCSLIDARSCETVSIVKFPLVESAKERLRHEFDVLLQLADEKLGIAPLPLSIHREALFSSQTYLSGRSADIFVQETHVAFLAKLFRPLERIELRTVGDALRRDRDKLVDARVLQGQMLAKVDEALTRTRWEGDVPSVRTHGDFAPWNLKSSIHGVQAVDWEDSATRQLPYLDLYHFRRAVKLALGKNAVVPWEAYTAALMRADPGLTAGVAGAAKAAAGLVHMLKLASDLGWATDDDNVE